METVTPPPPRCHFKSDRCKREYENAPPFLKQCCDFFVDLCADEGITPTVVRVLEKIDGSSGVHEAGRAVDFRDEHDIKGFFTFSPDQRERIVAKMNTVYKRNDRKPTCYHHSFQGGMFHFHVQVSADPTVYLPGKTG